MSMALKTLKVFIRELNTMYFSKFLSSNNLITNNTLTLKKNILIRL